MTGTYELFCEIAAVGCLISALIGALAFRSGFAHPRAWFAIRVAQGMIVSVAAFGAVLMAGVGERGHGLQYGYSLMAAAVSFAAEQLRLASAQTVLARIGVTDSDGVNALPEEDQERLARQIALRELGVETVSLLVCVALLLRGANLY
jgi:hypothetical protein